MKDKMQKQDPKDALPTVFKQAATRSSIIDDDGMVLARTRLLFDSIMIRLLPHYGDLCAKYGGPGALDMCLIPCVDMLISRVEGSRERERRMRCYWMRKASMAGLTWSAFKSLETEILRCIDFNLYKEGIDAEYEQGELSLWVRYGVI